MTSEYVTLDVKFHCWISKEAAGARSALCFWLYVCPHQPPAMSRPGLRSTMLFYVNYNNPASRKMCPYASSVLSILRVFHVIHKGQFLCRTTDCLDITDCKMKKKVSHDKYRHVTGRKHVSRFPSKSKRNPNTIVWFIITELHSSSSSSLL